MNESMTIKTGKWRLLAAALTAALLGWGFYATGQSYEIKDYYTAAATLAVAMAVLAALLKIKCAGRMAGLWNTLLFLACAGFSFTIFQMSQNQPFIGNSEVFFLNWICCLAPYILLFIITGRPRVSMVLGGVLLFLLALGNYFINVFRGTPLLYTDFLSARTAMDVVEGYTFEWSYTLMLMTAAFVALLFWALKGNAKCSDKVVGIKLRLGTMVGLVLSVSLFVQLDSEKYYDSWGDYTNGYPYTFCINAKMLNVEIPEGYDAFSVAEEMYAGERRAGTFAQADRGEVDRDFESGLSEEGYEETYEKPAKPNIIAIMNESFSDLKTVGDFETNMPVTPFLDSIKDESLQGIIGVSVFGGGTCDSEYSFLTGNTTAFLPENARPYQLYVDEGDPSLVSTLNAQGYHSEAIHPGVRTAWNRDQVYENLGFGAFYSGESFGGTKLTRGALVSDEATYDKIIDIYENKPESQPLFVFDVTIQNHGAYTADASDLESVTLENMEGDYPKTEQYLSLIHNSDQAFENLVDYFREQEEPTIIVMFGDHQGTIETEFYEELFGKPKADWSLEEVQRTYQTPYVIWANYPLEPQADRTMSVQNLAAYVLDQTGLEQPEYSRYLSALAEELPVINSQGMIDAEGNCYAYNEQNPYRETILNYQRILYNSIFDKAHRQDQLYFIDRDAPEDESLSEETASE